MQINWIVILYNYSTNWKYMSCTLVNQIQTLFRLIFTLNLCTQTLWLMLITFVTKRKATYLCWLQIAEKDTHSHVKIKWVAISRKSNKLYETDDRANMRFLCALKLRIGFVINMCHENWNGDMPQWRMYVYGLSSLCSLFNN